MKIATLAISKDVSMSTKEDEISLRVERCDLSALEFGDLRKHGRKEPTNGMTEARLKVVQNDLGGV